MPRSGGGRAAGAFFFATLTPTGPMFRVSLPIVAALGKKQKQPAGGAVMCPESHSRMTELRCAALAALSLFDACIGSHAEEKASAFFQIGKDDAEVVRHSIAHVLDLVESASPLPLNR